MTDLRIIITKEAEGFFTANCVDFDIATQGDSLKQVQQRMQDQLIVEAMNCLSNDCEPFEGIPKPPKAIEEIWQSIEGGFSSSHPASFGGNPANLDYRLSA